MAMLILLNSIL